MLQLSQLLHQYRPRRAAGSASKQKAPHDEVRTTPWGFQFVGHEKMAAGTFEPQETALVRSELLKVDALINVGANVGYYCCHALSLGRHVLAVEPVHRNVEYLLTNITSNGWSEGVRVMPVAAGAHPDVLAIWGGGTAASMIRGWAGNPAQHVSLVPVLPLDELVGSAFAEQRLLVIVDVEGAEFQLLQGAFATLGRIPRPIWIMEISLHEHQPVGVKANPRFADTFEFFFRHGYRAFTADDAQQEVTRDDVSAFVHGERDTATHNYLFK